ncbi:coenzyme A biosynthesis bifunctional protein CoaBC [bacterium BMS3Abin05]|nr:coenzyme A biosynthesis bifunctional protein CoaBC [bacterium BMS3Abin05]GBE27325.1 coenzyme A biosynthesis bifunctional protein CoaBC [bacterium BMS3Bbin03]HDL78369.1 bifunctional phosphopantothenoylcysteine decarboxylase/phosphopantothenate--cysteine ligase CoaBC [Bacteroidota bacterium]HDZ13130.1 bifunctional phosphopantothenoylcysteine decarboxylase/phosphopantothenate--cysteine ligase CoaBC [Bacteroidota bacterium]
MKLFENKKILFGVTGGIAAYKACDIVRELKKQGADVQVAMTQSAQKFISPLTFETLSDRDVLTEMFPAGKQVGTRHIEIPRQVDRVFICPATANFIAKAASGIADDLLSTMVTVAGSEKTVFCPAMNTDMYANPILQENISKLKNLGYRFVPPDSGELACHTKGMGRLANKERLMDVFKEELIGSGDLKGHSIIVTAGPTEEPIDPVRFITNASSGKMGFAVAEAAALAGADVTLISGPTHLRPFTGVHYIPVRTADKMHKATLKAYEKANGVIMAAAVSDYRPAVYSDTKTKKGAEEGVIELKKNPDILKELGKKKNGRVLIGFAVETNDELNYGRQKLLDKNLDMIVVNNPKREGAGFGIDTNIVTFIFRSGETQTLPKLPKFEVARRIVQQYIRIGSHIFQK